MKQYANQTVYFGISPLLKDETSFKAGMKQAEEALSACIFYERSEPLPYRGQILKTPNKIRQDFLAGP